MSSPTSPNDDQHQRPSTSLKQVLYQKTKDGHTKIVDRLQRRILKEKILGEEKQKLELQKKAERFMKQRQFLERVKNPKLVKKETPISPAPKKTYTTEPDRPKSAREQRLESMKNLSEEQKNIQSRLNRLESAERLKLRKQYPGPVPASALAKLHREHAIRRHHRLPEIYPLPEEPSSTTADKQNTDVDNVEQHEYEDSDIEADEEVIREAIREFVQKIFEDLLNAEQIAEFVELVIESIIAENSSTDEEIDGFVFVHKVDGHVDETELGEHVQSVVETLSSEEYGDFSPDPELWSSIKNKAVTLTSPSEAERPVNEEKVRRSSILSDIRKTSHQLRGTESTTVVPQSEIVRAQVNVLGDIKKGAVHLVEVPEPPVLPQSVIVKNQINVIDDIKKGTFNLHDINSRQASADPIERVVRSSILSDIRMFSNDLTPSKNLTILPLSEIVKSQVNVLGEIKKQDVQLKDSHSRPLTTHSDVVKAQTSIVGDIKTGSFELAPVDTSSPSHSQLVKTQLDIQDTIKKRTFDLKHAEDTPAPSDPEEKVKKSSLLSEIRKTSTHEQLRDVNEEKVVPQSEIVRTQQDILQTIKKQPVELKPVESTTVPPQSEIVKTQQTILGEIKKQDFELDTVATDVPTYSDLIKTQANIQGSIKRGTFELKHTEETPAPTDPVEKVRKSSLLCSIRQSSTHELLRNVNEEKVVPPQSEIVRTQTHILEDIKKQPIELKHVEEHSVVPQSEIVKTQVNVLQSIKKHDFELKDPVVIAPTYSELVKTQIDIQDTIKKGTFDLKHAEDTPAPSDPEEKVKKSSLLSEIRKTSTHEQLRDVNEEKVVPQSEIVRTQQDILQTIKKQPVELKPVESTTVPPQSEIVKTQLHVLDDIKKHDFKLSEPEVVTPPISELVKTQSTIQETIKKGTFDLKHAEDTPAPSDPEEKVKKSSILSEIRQSSTHELLRDVNEEKVVPQSEIVRTQQDILQTIKKQPVELKPVDTAVVVPQSEIVKTQLHVLDDIKKHDYKLSETPSDPQAHSQLVKTQLDIQDTIKKGTFDLKHADDTPAPSDPEEKVKKSSLLSEIRKTSTHEQLRDVSEEKVVPQSEIVRTQQDVLQTIKKQPVELKPVEATTAPQSEIVRTQLHILDDIKKQPVELKPVEEQTVAPQSEIVKSQQNILTDIKRQTVELHSVAEIEAPKDDVDKVRRSSILSEIRKSTHELNHVDAPEPTVHLETTSSEDAEHQEA